MSISEFASARLDEIYLQYFQPRHYKPYTSHNNFSKHSDTGQKPDDISADSKTLDRGTPLVTVPLSS